MDELLATGAFTPALSPEQQKIADDPMARRGGRDGHRPHGGHPRPARG